jgi:predicted ATP-dependent endonuclease of OLD family
MQLRYVVIKNYRSIKYLQIALEPKCRILVGINESGKTNILKALNLLDPKQVTTRRDLSEPGLREAPIKEGYVRFVFGLTEEEGTLVYCPINKW